MYSRDELKQAEKHLIERCKAALEKGEDRISFQVKDKYNCAIHYFIDCKQYLKDMEEEFKVPGANAAPKTEYQSAMDTRIYQIEVDLENFKLENSRDPECIIIGNNTIHQLLDYMNMQPDWNNEEGVAIELGGFTVRIFRTTDLKNGRYFIR